MYVFMCGMPGRFSDIVLLQLCYCSYSVWEAQLVAVTTYQRQFNATTEAQMAMMYRWVLIRQIKGIHKFMLFLVPMLK